MKKISMLVVAASLCWALGAEDDDAKALPAGAGREAVVKVCLTCHLSYRFRQLRLNREEWSDQAYDMVDRGAKATEEELTAVVDYLARNFGKDAKVNVNTAPALEMRTLLGFTLAEAEAVVQFRKDKGSFKEWRDLLQVPGVDAAKVEAKKELMAF